MININRVDSNQYRFPTIDFKFQNTGNATAFLWQFITNITYAEVDPTPLMNFNSSIFEKELHLNAINQGWGNAHQCLIKIIEPTLNKIFPAQILQYKNTFKSGETITICKLSKELIIPEKFSEINQKFNNIILHDPHFYLYKDEYIDKNNNLSMTQGIELRPINVLWNCIDEKGKRYKGQDTIKTFIGKKGVYVVQNNLSIYRVPYRVPYREIESDTTYVVIIDPDNGIHEKKYPISRKIFPGNIERFHIMIGSSKSAYLKINFKFYIDKSKTIKSKEFEIDIWNPRNYQLHRKYKDGDKLNRKMKEL